jgi:hypothetical protein
LEKRCVASRRHGPHQRLDWHAQAHGKIYDGLPVLNGEAIRQ